MLLYFTCYVYLASLFYPAYVQLCNCHRKERGVYLNPPHRPIVCLRGLYTHPQYMLRVRNRRNRNFFNTCKNPNWLLVSIDWFMMSTSYILVPSLMGASGYIFKVLLLYTDLSLSYINVFLSSQHSNIDPNLNVN